MSIEFITLLALAVSFICLFYLRESDPKRRRAFHLAKWAKKRYVTTAWLLCLSPGALLLFMEYYSPFIMWSAALSLVGWALALPKPKNRSNT
ncbi:MAG: hypothetical protein COA95_03345 [Methylophaga sp.]|nr:MAG: hypothetical protein COA95_03345 [Methylophaga sp.]